RALPTCIRLPTRSPHSKARRTTPGEPKPRTCRRYLRQRHAIIAGAAAGLPEAVHLRMPDRTALLHATIMPGSNDRVGFLEPTIDGQPSWCLLVGRAHESAPNESMQWLLELCYTSCRP